jgi:hypothetical protein
MDLRNRLATGDIRRCRTPGISSGSVHFLWLTLIACGHGQTVAPIPTPAETPAPKPATTAPLVPLTVLPIISRNLDPSVVSMITSVLTAEVHAAPGYSVINVEDLNARLTLEKQKDLLGCDEEKCLTEIGGALGVARIVSSSAGAVGGTMVIQLTLIQTNDGRVLGRIYESAAGPVDLLIPLSRRAVHRLFELPGAPPEIPKQGEPIARPQMSSSAPTLPQTDRSQDLKTGGLNVDAVTPGTSVRVSGPNGFHFEGTLPWLAVALTPGKYRLHMTGPGRAAKEIQVDVVASQLTGVITQLEQAPMVSAEIADASTSKTRTETLAQVERPLSDAKPTDPSPRRAASNPSRAKWLRCPVGQSRAGAACEGKAKVLNWESAQSACPPGYRISSPEELLALLDCYSDAFHPGNCQPCGLSPECRKLFGDDRSSYWTSATQDEDGIVVRLHVGMAERDGKDFGHAVRCVKP